MRGRCPVQQAAVAVEAGHFVATAVARSANHPLSSAETAAVCLDLLIHRVVGPPELMMVDSHQDTGGV